MRRQGAYAHAAPSSCRSLFALHLFALLLTIHLIVRFFRLIACSSPSRSLALRVLLLAIFCLVARPLASSLVVALAVISF
jgi:hypothetical protein